MFARGSVPAGWRAAARQPGGARAASRLLQPRPTPPASPAAPRDAPCPRLPAFPRARASRSRRSARRASDLLEHAARAGALRPGLTLIGDKGFADRDFEDLLRNGFGLYLIRPDRRDETPRHGSIGWIRQWIESVNDTLKGQLELERHGGRTTDGLYVRIAQRLLAMAACIWHNWATGTGDTRSLIAYDH